MRVLVVDAYPEGHAAAVVVDSVITTLEGNGHVVERHALAGDEWESFMTADEKRAYETDEPLIAPETRAAAAAVQAADALVFCYPTTMFGVPPVLKGWLERVMVLGVAFVFDRKRRVRPGLKNIRRLGVVTTSPHGRRRTWRARDGGFRTFMRTLRLNCHPLCRHTFIRLPAGDEVAEDSLRRLGWK